MNDAAEVEARPRPLSTGLWTLFSWLRRDERSDSSDSLSSAGSDRTVASFAFLTPAHYQPATVPFVLPPPGPPTDSYKKRVHDRNLRRQYDRDITLHRKYGLFKSGEATCGYDAFSLPPARRINGDPAGRWDRDRRATSECYQRRLAHVPGKRRAPLPPINTATTTPVTSLTRRSTRKRRAPQPPVKVIEKNKENIHNAAVTTIVTQMNPQPSLDKHQLRSNDVSMGCKSEKYSKKEGSKDTKIKSEKSFLKHIFDSKKRNSAIDISSIKLLPSISELDKQAAEIIETCKLNPSEQNNNVKNIILAKVDAQRSSQHESWICVNCLRKYKSSILTCSYCVPIKKINSKTNNEETPSTSKATSCFTQTEKNLPSTASTDKQAAEEKQKLKEMLKEIKDSLPKRPKHNNKTDIKTMVTTDSHGVGASLTETPTLRVGSTIPNDHKTISYNQPITENCVTKPESMLTTPTSHQQSPATTQPATAVQVMPAFKKYFANNNANLQNSDANKINNSNTKPLPNIQRANANKVTHIAVIEELKDKKDLNSPLKISSLLNPVYVPKKIESNVLQTTNASQTESKTQMQKGYGNKTDDVHKTCQSKINTSFADALAESSKTQINRLPVSIDKGENKLKIETPQKTTVSPGSSKSTNLQSPESKKDNKDDSKGKVLSSAQPQEQILVKDSNAQDQHSRRRDLIRQLEQSIAKGDERAAAEAAAKLAQLKLSCSVLSYSSQILSEPSTSAAIATDTTSSNKLSVKSNIFADKSKKESEFRQLSSVKEGSPQKVIAYSATAGADLPLTNVTTTPVVNVVSLKDKSQQSTQESIIKKILLERNKEKPKNEPMVTISVLVEDREATRGPVQLRIRREALMRDLRREAETSLGLATNLQRWIVGRALCVNDNTPIISLAGNDFSAPFYLCVVESETKTDSTSPKIVEKSNNGKSEPAPKVGNVYNELMQLEQQALVPNAENFECAVCMEEYLPGRGVVLRECVHIFCKVCLADVIHHCEEPDVPCPAMGCPGMLQEREIRALVTPQDYERWLARGLAAAESGTRNAFHCRTRDCKGWALCEPGVQRFPCPVCKRINCVPCQAIHDGETCEQHRNRLKQAAASKSARASDTDDGTRTLLNSLIAKGEALECPECSAIITKKWGCDWVKCSACKTEICWVTRGRRWGPGGKGDTSAGCRCGVDGKRCHPACGYCH